MKCLMSNQILVYIFSEIKVQLEEQKSRLSMSVYHANPESLTEDERRALDEKWRIEQEIDNTHEKASNWKTVKSRPAEVALHSYSVASDVAAREEVATTVKSVHEFPAAAPAAAPPGAALVALEPGSGAAALEPELGLVAEHTPSDEEKDQIDVAFAFDFTGSMQPNIYAARDAVKNVVTGLQKGNPDTILHAAFVGYRDINPLKPILPQQHEAGQYEIVDFTSDMTIVYCALDNARADGGYDIAENMAGALDKVGKLSWPKKTSRITRKVIIITDAPCHGAEYHDIEVSDNFPRGCPFGFDPKKQIAEFARQNIDVIVVRLVHHTLDKMIEVFDAAYQSGRIPGGTADFIVMDAIQQSAPSSSYYRPSIFADEDVDRCSMYVPKYEDCGANRSFGCDDDDDSVSRSFSRRDVNRGGNDSDDEAPPFMAAPMPAAAATASMPAAKTMEDVFREAFSKRKL